MSSISSSAILDSAQQLVREFGADFTMEQLEQRVGVSRATLYRRVGSKSQLLDALASERNEPIDDTRRIILRAARVVFGRDGLRGATMERVAAEADLGIATVYRYFATKDRLLRAFLEEMTPRPMIQAFTDTAGDDLEGELTEVTSALVGFAHELRDILRVVLFGDTDERRYVERFRRGTDSSFEWLVGFFERHRAAGHLVPTADPSDLALSLMGIVFAFALIGPEHYATPLTDRESTAETIVSLFLTGAGVPQ